MTSRKRPDLGFSHRLEWVVRAAFKKQQKQDRISLGVFMAGATSVSRGASEAYAKVAEDVLGYMEKQGKVQKDSEGWFELTNKGSLVCENSLDACKVCGGSRRCTGKRFPGGDCDLCNTPVEGHDSATCVYCLGWGTNAEHPCYMFCDDESDWCEPCRLLRGRNDERP